MLHVINFVEKSDGNQLLPKVINLVEKSDGKNSSLSGTFQQREAFFQDAKVNQYEFVFNHFDENGDGKISPSEFTQCLKHIFGGIPSPEFVELVVGYLDIDGDGLMRLDQFLWFMYLRRDEDKVNKLKDAFTLYDKKAGLVSKMSHTAENGDGKKEKSSLADELLQYMNAGEMPFEVFKRRSTKNRRFSKHNSEPSLGFSLKIPQDEHRILLAICIGILSYFAKTLTNPLFLKTTDTSELLTSGQAFTGFTPEICHITGFIICFFLAFFLILQLGSGVQIVLILLLITTTLFDLPDLIDKLSASRINVLCGSSFKLSLFWFSSLCAVGLSVFFGLVVLLFVYLGWVFMHKRKPKGEELKLESDVLTQFLPELSEV